MIIPGFENELPFEELDIFNHGRYDEVVQMLSDLGYLSISLLEGEIVPENELEDAVSLFRKELLDEGLIEYEDVLKKWPDEILPQKFQVLSFMEFYFLHELVSLDGDFLLKALPEIGSLNIPGRVVQYRLHLLGLLDHVGHPFDFRDRAAWNRLEQYIPGQSVRELLRLTGDINALLFVIKDSPRLNNRLVCFRYSASPSIVNQYNIMHPLSRGVFSDQYRDNVSPQSPDFRNFKKKIHSRNPDFQYLQNLYDGEDNDFLVRLIQLLQWSSGYYHGKIDGSFGEYSFESFLELGRFEVEGGNHDFQFKRFVGHVGRDFWIANVHYLLDSMQRPDEKLDVKSVLSVFYNKYDELPKDDKERFNQNMESAWKEANRSSRTHLRSSQFRLRRIYFGIKNMLRSFWHSMEQLFDRFVKNTKEFIHSMTNGIKSFAKFLYKEIREAIYMFAEGMSFLFGKREYTFGEWTSKFDFDCDLINVYYGSEDKQSGVEHINMIRSKMHSLDFCLSLTGKVIHFILLSQGIGWRRIAMEAGVIFKQMIKEKIRKGMI